MCNSRAREALQRVIVEARIIYLEDSLMLTSSAPPLCIYQSSNPQDRFGIASLAPKSLDNPQFQVWKGTETGFLHSHLITLLGLEDFGVIDILEP